MKKAYRANQALLNPSTLRRTNNAGSRESVRTKKVQQKINEEQKKLGIYEPGLDMFKNRIGKQRSELYHVEHGNSFVTSLNKPTCKKAQIVGSPHSTNIHDPTIKICDFACPLSPASRT